MTVHMQRWARLSRRWRRLVLVAIVLAAGLAVSLDRGQAASMIASRTLAEAKVAQLPTGPLLWRLESFPSPEAARAVAGPSSLVLEESDRTLLATLHTSGSAPGQGTLVAEIGPVSAPQAATYLLRVVEITGPAGSTTSIHMHPGSEAYYVLTGQLSVRSLSGIASAGAGSSLVGPPAASSMQAVNSGTSDLRAFAFFVVASEQPFSSPATFDKPDCIYFAETGNSLCAGFRAYWEHFGGLAVYGYPISAELVDGNGHTVQWFERARFEWHPGASPERYDVLLGRIGAELAQQQRVPATP